MVIRPGGPALHLCLPPILTSPGWHSTLEAIVSHGWLPNTPDRLILHAEKSLLETLRYERVGKPLCLGTVIVGCFSCSTKVSSRQFFLLAKTELVNSRDAVPHQQFLTRLQSVHVLHDAGSSGPGWLPYRVVLFVVGKPLQWTPHQLNLNSAEYENDTERWNRIKGYYVPVCVTERAADAVLTLQARTKCEPSRYPVQFDSLRVNFAASALPGVTLSDEDIERDRRVLITEKEVRRSAAATLVRTSHLFFSGNQIHCPASSSTQEVTTIDRGLLELRTAITDLST